MPELSLYQWKRDSETCFEDMLSYAWYLFIENKDEEIRLEANRSLRLIKEAAQLASLSRKPLDGICTIDLLCMKSILTDVIIEGPKARLAILYLLKFIHLLNGRNLIAINIIDVAAAL